ncbi:hypothetical protein B0H10DRAFT_1816948, partial [Mycena sp. CBHHK59/15]
TQTVAQRTVYHTLTAEVRSMMNGVQTIEQLNDLQERLGQVGYVHDTLQDPPTVTRKGRPLTTRLTGATEGRPQGGGGSRTSQVAGITQRRPNCCSRCKQPGHNRSSCPN